MLASCFALLGHSLLSGNDRARFYSLQGNRRFPCDPPFKNGSPDLPDMSTSLPASHSNRRTSAGGFVAAARTRRLYGQTLLPHVSRFSVARAPSTGHAATLGRPHRRSVLLWVGWRKDGMGGGYVLRPIIIARNPVRMDMEGKPDYPGWERVRWSLIRQRWSWGLFYRLKQQIKRHRLRR
jgi:hypothetical protein